MYVHACVRECVRVCVLLPIYACTGCSFLNCDILYYVLFFRIKSDMRQSLSTQPHAVLCCCLPVLFGAVSTRNRARVEVIILCKISFGNETAYPHFPLYI